ncbi:MAG: hypothetical protein JKY45_00415 [Emcibacter sp.]|nr:hypothetical protein [Emcibacter sp.]
MEHPLLTAHFKLTELTRSSIALRHGIGNDPGPEEVVNLTRLAQHILEPVRQNFALAFSPSSGFRSHQVNKLAGSNGNSQHVTGHAVDFEIPTIPNRILAHWIKDNLVFDQLILEFHQEEDSSSGWIHCSYNQNKNRKACLIFNGTEYRVF